LQRPELLSATRSKRRRTDSLLGKRSLFPTLALRAKFPFWRVIVKPFDRLTQSRDIGDKLGKEGLRLHTERGFSERLRLAGEIRFYSGFSVVSGWFARTWPGCVTAERWLIVFGQRRIPQP
jgi:hypothetical protein